MHDFRFGCAKAAEPHPHSNTAQLGELRRSGRGGAEVEGDDGGAGTHVLEMQDLAESLRVRGIKISKPSSVAAGAGAASSSPSSPS